MKKILSVFLCLTMIFSMFAMNASAFTAGGECKDGNCEYLPTIIIPGLGQSNVWLLDDNGEFVLNDEGKKTGVFPGVINLGEIIKTALVPLLLSVATQSDMGFSDAVAEIINDDDAVPQLKQGINQMAADETRSSSDQNLHLL